MLKGLRWPLLVLVLAAGLLVLSIATRPEKEKSQPRPNRRLRYNRPKLRNHSPLIRHRSPPWSPRPRLHSPPKTS